MISVLLLLAASPPGALAWRIQVTSAVTRPVVSKCRAGQSILVASGAIQPAGQSDLVASGAIQLTEEDTNILRGMAKNLRRLSSVLYAAGLLNVIKLSRNIAQQKHL